MNYFFLSQKIVAAIDGNPDDPGRKGAVAAEMIKSPVGPQHGLLCAVLRILFMAQHPQAGEIHLLFTGCCQLFKTFSF